MSEATRTLNVKFTKQQLVFLEMLKKEGRFGNAMEEVLRETFREYLRTMLPNRGRNGQ